MGVADINQSTLARDPWVVGYFVRRVERKQMVAAVIQHGADGRAVPRESETSTDQTSRMTRLLRRIRSCTHPE